MSNNNRAPLSAKSGASAASVRMIGRACIGDHEAYAFGRIGRIEGEVGSPGFVNGEYRDDQRGRTGQGNTDD